MKRSIVFIIAAICTISAGYAQLPTFNLGVKAGINYSKLKTKSDLTDENSILGYQIGVWGRLGGAGMYFQPELYLGSKGNDFISIEDQSGNEVSAKGKVRFTTLDVPLLLGKKFGPSKLNVHFMAGPVISFLVDKNTTFNSAYQNVTDFRNYKNQAIALQVGGGVDLGNLSVDLRYEAGLSNLSKSEKYSQKQNLFHLSLGLKLL